MARAIPWAGVDGALLSRYSFLALILKKVQGPHRGAAEQRLGPANAKEMSDILVVDDEAAIRCALRSFLESQGYEVREAQNGVEALREIARKKPDLVILDVLMSPISGWEVLQLLHSNPETADIRVLVLTALGLERDEALGWHLGCDWYEVKKKPMEFEDLGLIVQRLLAIDPEQEKQTAPTA